MSLNLPEHSSLEFLKKLAKDRLAVLRATHPSTQLAVAQLGIAREYGFSRQRIGGPAWIRTKDQGIHVTGRFPSRADYLFTLGS